MMTMGRGTWVMVALALLAGGAGCGAAGNGVDTGDNSVVVIHVDIPAGLPDIFQIEVDAHLGSAGKSNTLYFPTEPQQDQPIASGATLGLLIKPSIMDILDLTIYGLDKSIHRLAVGMDQVNPIMVGGSAERTIGLMACPASGC